jgi:hypothetical protein
MKVIAKEETCKVCGKDQLLLFGPDVLELWNTGSVPPITCCNEACNAGLDVNDYLNNKSNEYLILENSDSVLLVEWFKHNSKALAEALN